MKTSKLALAFLLCHSFASYGMDKRITMPNKAVLRERLKAINMDHFMEKTNILDVLADKKKAVLGVNIAMELAIADYRKYLTQGPGASPATRPLLAAFLMNKPLLIEALLKDHPEGLSALQEAGLYQPIAKK